MISGLCKEIAQSSNVQSMYGKNDPPSWSAGLSALLDAVPGTVTVFEHSGLVDHATVQRSLDAAEQASQMANDPTAIRKRLMNVLVEALENMLHHTVPHQQEACFATLLSAPQGYRLVLGNPVPLTTAALLMHRVGVLNEMDDVELKAHHLMLLTNTSRTERGGAGLGLVTMARRSSRPMRTSTFPFDRDHAYFCLELALHRAAIAEAV